MSDTQRAISQLTEEVASYMASNLKLGVEFEGLEASEITILCSPHASVYVVAVIRDLIDAGRPYGIVTLDEKLIDHSLSQPFFRGELQERSGLTPEQAEVALKAIKHVFLSSPVFNQPVQLQADGWSLTFSR